MADHPDDVADPADLDGIAADLYALTPADFVAARGAAQKQARRDGQRELAAAIGKLAKPTVVAWLANQLVRAHPDELGPLLELGAGLREATAALEGDQLRALSRQQHQVIDALVAQARLIGRAAGQELNESTARGLEETLRAALADSDLADQLAKGQLTKPLEHVGFSANDGASGIRGASAARTARTANPGKPTAALDRKAAQEREARERQAAQEREKEEREKEARRLAVLKLKAEADADIGAAQAEVKAAEAAVQAARTQLVEARAKRAALE